MVQAPALVSSALRQASLALALATIRDLATIRALALQPVRQQPTAVPLQQLAVALSQPSSLQLPHVSVPPATSVTTPNTATISDTRTISGAT